MTPPRTAPRNPASAPRHAPPLVLANTRRYHESDLFLTLGDGIVRRLLDVLLRLDTIRDVLDESDSTSVQAVAARGDLRALVADLEHHIRVSNAAMLDISSAWPTPEPGR